MLAGAADDTLAALGLDRSSAYRLLCGSSGLGTFARVRAGVVSTGEEEEAAVRKELSDEYSTTSDAMSALSLGGEAVLQLLAAVLHLGQVEFEPHTPAG